MKYHIAQITQLKKTPKGCRGGGPCTTEMCFSRAGGGTAEVRVPAGSGFGGPGQGRGALFQGAEGCHLPASSQASFRRTLISFPGLRSRDLMTPKDPPPNAITSTSGL